LLGHSLQWWHDSDTDSDPQKLRIGIGRWKNSIPESESVISYRFRFPLKLIKEIQAKKWAKFEFFSKNTIIFQINYTFVGNSTASFLVMDFKRHTDWLTDTAKYAFVIAQKIGMKELIEKWHPILLKTLISHQQNKNP
jgi:hypothetical protein